MLQGRNLVWARAHNRTVILHLLQAQETVTRVALASHSRLTRATISNIVGEFLQLGIVREIGEEVRDSSGRRRTLLQLNPGAFSAIGALISLGQVDALLVNARGDELLRITIRTDTSSPENTARALCDAVGRLLAHDSSQWGTGEVVVAVPGIVDESGAVKYSSHLGWKEVDFATLASTECGRNVIVENKMFAAAWAEVNPIYSEDQPLCYVSYGTGIGCCLVNERAVYRGAAQAAGELGHITVDPNGAVCACGNRGCLEAEAAFGAVVKAYRESGGHLAAGWDDSVPLARRAEAVFSSAEKGDPVAGAVVRRTSQYVGVALATVLNLFNPKELVLDLGIREGREYFRTLIEEEARQRALSHVVSNVRIREPRYGSSNPLFGAARMALDRYISKLGAVRVSSSDSSI